MATIGAREVTLLDDGMMTIPLARTLAGMRGYDRPGHRTSRRRALLASLARDRMLALAARERLSFFTAFAEHDALAALDGHGIGVADNAFDWLRANGRPVTVPGDRVVLGAAAVADGGITAPDYLAWVRSVAGTEPAAYLPHRREPAAVVDAVAGIPGVTVVRTGIPVELALAGTTRALDIVTLRSTAALTLATVLAGTGTRIRTGQLRERVG